MQGLGAAILSPAALSIVTTTFQDGAERNKALGAWGAVAGSGGAAGVLLGGVLTQYAGWEWVLWVNVPIGLAAAYLAPRLLAESRSESETRAFDFAGAATVTAGLSVLVYALVEAPDAGWGSGQTIGLLAAAVALLAAFVAIERRSAAPLVPFSIFRMRTLTGANVVGLLTGASLFSMFFFISLYMQNVLGYSAIKAGLSYLPLAVTIIIAAGVASQLVTRVGFKPVLAVGMLMISGGLFWFGQISAGGSFLGDVLGPVVARGRRARVRLRAADDRRRLRRRGARGGARERPDQHLAAGRRGARAGAALHGRVHPDRRRGDRHGRPAEPLGAHGRLRRRVHGRLGDRPARGRWRRWC